MDDHLDRVLTFLNMHRDSLSTLVEDAGYSELSEIQKNSLNQACSSLDDSIRLISGVLDELYDSK